MWSQNMIGTNPNKQFLLLFLDDIHTSVFSIVTHV